MASVIVFGPTGQIGSVAARTASEHGATVWLAMRDTTKPIPGLTKEVEKAGSFHRVHADLQKPETVSDAVKTSGAKRAFLYLAHGSSDHMKATLGSLKSAGIDFVVFISSFTIPIGKALREVLPAELIAYLHAQVEANLDDIFGPEHYVAVRPGAFASNLLRERKGVAAGEVSFYGGVFTPDNISPSDIGRVSGTVLVSGPRNGQKKVYLYGPEMLSLGDSYVRVGHALGKEIKLTSITPDEAKANFISVGMPEHFAKYMVHAMGDDGPDKSAGGRFPHYEEGVDNVKLYTGRPSMSLEAWVKENETAFA